MLVEYNCTVLLSSTILTVLYIICIMYCITIVNLLLYGIFRKTIKYFCNNYILKNICIMQFSNLPYPNLLHFILKMQIYNGTNQNSMTNMEIRLKMKEYILNSP